MLEQQRARQPGETMALCGRTYKVEEVVDSDGMYMNYRVSFPQLKPQWESVVYELYPKGMGEHIRRGADGALFCDDVGKMEMQAYVLPFWKGFQAQADALAGMLSSREGGIGYVSTHGGHYILRVSPRGTPLSRRLSGSPLSFEALMGIAADLLDGLEHYHQRGLLHLDICPQTVRLLEGCGVLLEHRGYGLWLSQMPGAFPLAGTPGYAPPEVQLRNYSQIDQTSDLYAVCAVLFRLLVGRPLGEEELLGSGLRRAFSPELAAFYHIPSKTMDHMARILRKGLHTLPRKRYQSVEELRLELLAATRHVLSQDPVSRRPPEGRARFV